MTKAFLLGMIAGSSRLTKEIDNPYNWHNQQEEQAYEEWSRGYKEASYYWENPLEDISNLGK